MTAPARGAALRLQGEVGGIVLIVCALFLFSMMDVAAKHLTANHHPMQVVWARFASQCFWACLLLAPRLPTLLKTDRPGLQILRSMFLFGASFSFFTAVAYMPLAEAIAIFEIAPLIITALAFLVLREPVGPRRWAGVAVGFCGAMIIIRPGGEVFTWVSVLPMIAACCYASYAIATRFVGDSESPWTSFVYTALFGTAAASVAAPFVWTTPTGIDAGIMATFGILGGIGHFCLILALQRASASVLAPFTYVGLVFGTFWGFAAFGELPDRWTVVGASVIVTAGLYVWWRERVRRGV
ncbi:MAG: DMT family transporter [Pseudomonadota bacterium]